jgi:BlaI family transcriptional regulator, penicillinase repressor
MSQLRIGGLTPRELGIMEVLWKHAAASVQDVQDGLGDRLEGSTIRTLLQIMEEKGHVTSWKEGRTNMYRSLIARDQVERSALSSMIKRVFGGSAAALLARMVEEEHVDVGVLDDLRSRLLKE